MLGLVLGLGEHELAYVATGLGVAIAVLVLATLYRRLNHARLKDAWERASWSLGLEFKAPAGPSTWRVSGALRGFPVQLRMVAFDAKVGTKKKKKKAKNPQLLKTRLLLDIGPEVPGDLLIQNRRGGSGTLGVRTGDVRFDRLVEVRGETSSAVARLNDTVRSRLLNFIPKQQLRLSEGKLLWESTGVLTRTVKLIDLTKRLVALAQALKGNGEKPEHNLLLLCQRDPNKSVQEVSFSVLLNRFPYKSETYRAAVAVLGPADPLTTMLSGMQAGVAGIDKVRQAASSKKLPPEMRVRAVEHLMSEHPTASGEVITAVVGPIVEHISEREAVRLAERVTNLDPSVAQRALVPFLRLGTSPVKIAALVGLTQVADDDVVPLLDTFVKDRDTDAKVVLVARQTIAAIRERSIAAEAKRAEVGAEEA